MTFMDLEQAYDWVNTNALWKISRIYGVEGKLLEAVRNCYQDCKACVQVGREESERF